MPQPLRMHQIKRIIELQLQGRSIREIERLTGISRNTVREYLRRMQSSGLQASEILKLEDESLVPIFHTDAIEKGQSGRIADERYKIFEEHVEYYCTELRKRGVTRFLLWKEYHNENESGYSYSQFCEYLSRYLKRDKAVMHFTHQPGEQLQVDFAGDKLSYVDRSTGEVILCEILVCVMPFSHYVFVKALRSQRQEDFIKGLGEALDYIGGVPQSIKCDNMRTAVTRANRYEPVFTEAMEYMAAHYGTTILAARVRKPRDKPSVEKAVDLTYKNIYAPLRHQTFYSMEELNAGIRKQLELFHQQPFKVKSGSRKQLFEVDEKPKLRELPALPYLIKNTTASKVQRNYHVIVGEDRHQYSVPYTLIGKDLKIIYTTETVEIYDGLSRVTLHKRSYKKNGYTTLAEHMPERHQHMTKQKGWDNAYFEKEAALVGQATLNVVRRILSSRNFYEQSYNSCLGILRLGKQYGSQRLEAACLRIEDAPVVNYTMLSNILKKHLDQIMPVQPINSTPGHDQIRGPQSYQ
jgi:transposase